MFVEIERLVFSCKPRTRVNEQAIFEDKEVRVPRVTMRNIEAVDFVPSVSVITGQDYDPGDRNLVPFGTAAEGKEVSLSEATEIREGIVVLILTRGADWTVINGG
tara:strand:- start:162 stop:476 length:315 start_codon:yes stop_codon:yes gene_type:complete